MKKHLYLSLTLMVAPFSSLQAALSKQKPPQDGYDLDLTTIEIITYVDDFARKLDLKKTKGNILLIGPTKAGRSTTTGILTGIEYQNKTIKKQKKVRMRSKKGELSEVSREVEKTYLESQKLNSPKIPPVEHNRYTSRTCFPVDYTMKDGYTYIDSPGLSHSNSSHKILAKELPAILCHRLEQNRLKAIFVVLGKGSFREASGYHALKDTLKEVGGSLRSIVKDEESEELKKRTFLLCTKHENERSFSTSMNCLKKVAEDIHTMRNSSNQKDVADQLFFLGCLGDFNEKGEYHYKNPKKYYRLTIDKQTELKDNVEKELQKLAPIPKRALQPLAPNSYFVDIIQKEITSMKSIITDFFIFQTSLYVYNTIETLQKKRKSREVEKLWEAYKDWYNQEKEKINLENEKLLEKKNEKEVVWRKEFTKVGYTEYFNVEESLNKTITHLRISVKKSASEAKGKVRIMLEGDNYITDEQLMDTEINQENLNQWLEKEITSMMTLSKLSIFNNVAGSTCIVEFLSQKKQQLDWKDRKNQLDDSLDDLNEGYQAVQNLKENKTLHQIWVQESEKFIVDQEQYALQQKYYKAPDFSDKKNPLVQLGYSRISYLQAHYEMCSFADKKMNGGEIHSDTELFERWKKFLAVRAEKQEINIAEKLLESEVTHKEQTPKEWAKEKGLNKEFSKYLEKKEYSLEHLESLTQEKLIQLLDDFFKGKKNIGNKQLVKIVHACTALQVEHRMRGDFAEEAEALTRKFNRKFSTEKSQWEEEKNDLVIDVELYKGYEQNFTIAQDSFEKEKEKTKSLTGKLNVKKNELKSSELRLKIAFGVSIVLGLVSAGEGLFLFFSFQEEEKKAKKKPMPKRPNHPMHRRPTTSDAGA